MSEPEVERRLEMKKEFTILRRLWLFVRIVWRHDQTGFRMSRATAWEVSKIVWSRTTPRDAAIMICCELYDRFVMGGWEPQDAHEYVESVIRNV